MYGTSIRFPCKTLAGVLAGLALAIAIQSVSFGAQSAATDNPAKPEVQQAVDQAKTSMSAFKQALTAAGIPTTGLDELISVVQELTQSTRADQHSIYLFVKQVNRNLDLLIDNVPRGGDSKAVTCKLACTEFKKHVLEKTAKLLESSYVDDLVQNKNLSHQIQLRLPLLVADSLLLSDAVDPEKARAAAAAAATAAADSAAAVKAQKENRQGNQAQSSKPQSNKPQDSNKPPGNTPQASDPQGSQGQGSDPSDATPPDSDLNPPDRNPSGNHATDSKTEAAKYVTVQCATDVRESESATQWECAAWNRRRDFQRDLDFLAGRYLTSKRFRFGIGLAYSYIPPVSYTFTSRFDYSPYQQTVTSAVHSPTTGLSGVATFADATYPGLLLSAKMPWVRLDAILSRVERTSTAVGPVWLTHADPSANPPVDVLTRDTVTSKLKVSYDLSLKAQLFEILRSWKVRVPPSRFEVGVGGGISGLRVQDSIATEIKKITQGMAFNDLPPGTVVNTSSDTSFHPVFLSTDLGLKISDEFQVNLEGRWYHNKSSVTKAIYVNGGTLSVSVVWYPTLF